MSEVDEWAEFRIKPTATPAAAPVDEWAEFRIKPAAKAEKPSVVADVAKSAGIGVVKGAIGTVGAVGDIRDALSWGAGALAEKFGIPKERYDEFASEFGKVARLNPMAKPFLDAPSSSDIQKRVERHTGEFYKPQSTAGEYAQTTGEFLPAAVGGAVSIPARAARVVIPAVASETAGQATKGTSLEPFARLAGAVGGGVGAGMLSRPGTTAQAIRQQLPDDVTPKMIDNAQGLMAEARGRGIDLAWPEALSQVAGRPVLTNTMRHLEASPQTEAQMAEFFGRRPQQVDQAARQQFDELAPPNSAPSTIGPAVGRAAGDEITGVRQAINSASEPFYDRSRHVQIPASDMATVRALPGYDTAVSAVS